MPVTMPAAGTLPSYIPNAARGELEKGRAGVEQQLYAFAHRQLPALVAPPRLLAASAPRLGGALAQLE